MAQGAANNTRTKRSGGSVATVTHALKGIGFPARKTDLLDRARKNHAERAVLDIIGAVPDQDYRTMADVMKGFGRAH
jgi:hypothetical protein